MTPTEIKFLLWILGGLLTVLAFIGVLAVNALIKMANDIGEIKVSVKEQSAKHEGLEKRIDIVEHKLRLA